MIIALLILIVGIVLLIFSRFLGVPPILRVLLLVLGSVFTIIGAVLLVFDLISIAQHDGSWHGIKQLWWKEGSTV